MQQGLQQLFSGESYYSLIEISELFFPINRYIMVGS